MDVNYSKCRLHDFVFSSRVASGNKLPMFLSIDGSSHLSLTNLKSKRDAWRASGRRDQDFSISACPHEWLYSHRDFLFQKTNGSHVRDI